MWYVHNNGRNGRNLPVLDSNYWRYQELPIQLGSVVVTRVTTGLPTVTTTCVGVPADACV